MPDGRCVHASANLNKNGASKTTLVRSTLDCLCNEGNAKIEATVKRIHGKLHRERPDKGSRNGAFVAHVVQEPLGIFGRRIPQTVDAQDVLRECQDVTVKFVTPRENLFSICYLSVLQASLTSVSPLRLEGFKPQQRQPRSNHSSRLWRGHLLSRQGTRSTLRRVMPRLLVIRYFVGLGFMPSYIHISYPFCYISYS